ncbi:LytTR family DNA-binding domain-containing protein [Sphingobacterium sp.]|uniref:LytR/AlgR family response regulator transcription factor n=1 Tax=Sphingobacterium sp. TaxID=341027 RepID=UPI00258BC5AF|nr:LytTR family DNA-binding domain-containing protein [Sphingobacterium sp.]WET69019.1 MAG: LytTR family DNA-binding domain-containing protein [Sphingobacterium sp.]
MKTLIVNSKNYIDVIEMNDIVFFMADNCYTKVVTKDGHQYVVSQTLAKVCNETEARFIRVNQSYLVNVNFISQVDKKRKTILLKESSEVKFTISQKKLLELITLCSKNS